MNKPVDWKIKILHINFLEILSLASKYTGWGISLGTVGVAVSRLKPHLSNFGSLLKLQRLIFPESLGMIK